MSTLVPIPKLGQSEETVKIEKWRVREGDKITKGDVLFEVETDKAVLEVESQFEGTLLKIVIPEGLEVPVMSTAAVIGEPGEKIPDIRIPRASPPEKKEEKAVPSQRTPMAQRKISAAAPYIQEQIPPSPAFRPKPSPRARKFASGYLINIDKVPGTGGGIGRVTEADVRRYLEESGYFKRLITPSAFNLAKKEKLELFEIDGGGENGRITVEDVRAAASEKPREYLNMRKTISRRLTESKQKIPHFYLTVSVDMTEVLKKKKELKDQGISLSVGDFIIKMAALSLKEYPMLNAETDGASIRFKSKVNIGVAVSLENGLVVPVIGNADKKAVDEIHAEVAELADKARAGNLPLDKMKGGTFTISNMGMLHVENFAAIINPGETAILAVSSALPSPVVKDGQIVVRSLMKMTVSADHRAVDGADAAKFANAVREKLESREFLDGICPK